jgi:hypothetical protein
MALTFSLVIGVQTLTPLRDVLAVYHGYEVKWGVDWER